MTKENIHGWYTYNGVEGILAYTDNEKFAGVSPIEEWGGMGFYSLESVKDIEFEAADTCCEYFASYSGDSDSQGDEIVLEQVRNQENEQCLLYAFCDKELWEDDLYERELNVFTNQYYDWKSELSKFYDWQEHEETSKEETENEWNEICKNYEGLNHYTEPKSFDEIWENIEYLRYVKNGIC